jgi:hypothetical protein
LAGAGRDGIANQSGKREETGKLARELFDVPALRELCRMCGTSVTRPPFAGVGARAVRSDVDYVVVLACREYESESESRFLAWRMRPVR